MFHFFCPSPKDTTPDTWEVLRDKNDQLLIEMALDVIHRRKGDSYREKIKTIFRTSPLLMEKIPYELQQMLKDVL